MSYAHNGKARLFWEEQGEGSPVLLVMGHTYSSAMWYLAVDELAKHHRVITFDNRGTGQSSKVRTITVEDMARDAFAVMDAANIDAAHLYGISLGGGIVLEMARQRPDRARSLVLGCTLAKTPDVARIPTVLKLLLRLPAPVFATLQKQMAGPPPAHPYGTAAPADKVARDLAQIAANVGSTKTSVAQTRAISRYSIEADDVRALSMPALVLHGDEDASVPYQAGVTLHELIAHSEMLPLAGAGHNYFVVAGDRANSAVLEFLTRVDSRSGTSDAEVVSSSATTTAPHTP